MFQFLSKPGKRKEGQKFMSTLTDIEVENDSVYATPKNKQGSKTPNLDYFPASASDRYHFTRSTKIEEEINEDEQINQYAQTLSYFKSKIKINTENLHSHSSLVTASSFSNRHLRSTQNLQFNSPSAQQKTSIFSVKDFSQYPAVYKQSKNIEFYEDVQNTDRCDQIDQYKQTQDHTPITLRERISSSSSLLPSQTFQFENSEQLLEKYIGKVSQKQLQISKLIAIQKQKSKESQLEKRLKAQEKSNCTTEMTSPQPHLLQQQQDGQSPLSYQTGLDDQSHSCVQSNDLIFTQQHQKRNKKYNSELVVKKHTNNYFNSFQGERASSFTLGKVNATKDNQTSRDTKKSSFVLNLTHKQLQPVKSTDSNHLQQNTDNQIPSSFSLTETLPKRSSSNHKCNSNQNIFSRDAAQTEPFYSTRKGNSVHSLVNPNNDFLNKQGYSIFNKGSGFMSSRCIAGFEIASNLKINRGGKRLASPFHRSKDIYDQMKSKLNSQFSDISSKIGFNIASLKQYFKNDTRVFRYVTKLLSKRNECLRYIFVKSEKRQEIYDNVTAIENNILDLIKQYELKNNKKKSSTTKSKNSKYDDSIIFIDSDQINSELKALYEDLEQLCLYKMKEKVTKAFEVVAFTDQRIEQNILDLQKQQKPIPLEFQNRKYLYMNQSILYMPEKLENYEKSHGPFSLISNEARILQKEIENKICSLKSIDREQRNPYRKSIIDNTHK